MTDPVISDSANCIALGELKPVAKINGHIMGREV